MRTTQKSSPSRHLRQLLTCSSCPPPPLRNVSASVTPHHPRRLLSAASAPRRLPATLRWCATLSSPPSP